MNAKDYIGYFDAAATRDALVEGIKSWFDRNGHGCNAVIGMSGGADSTIAAALCARAIGADRVMGVMLPNGAQADIDYAREACSAVGMKRVTYNIGSLYLEASIGAEISVSTLAVPGVHEITEQTKVNLQPRLRTAMLYAISQSVDGRVVGTSNLSEIMTGYFTKWGDECGDFKPLAALTKTEVVAMGLTMQELPKCLVEKTPSDGLGDRTDEEALGFSYADLDLWIRARDLPFTNLDRLARNIPHEVARAMEDRVAKSEFKRIHPETFGFCAPVYRDSAWMSNTNRKEKIQ